MGALHGALARLLSQKIADGSATSADLAVARGLLRDNGISADAGLNKDLTALYGALPFTGTEAEDDDDDIRTH